MQIGIVGLGRMGANIARRLVRHGHRVVGFNRTSEPTQALSAEGVIPTFTLAEMIAKLEPPRTIWVMVPAGEATESVVAELGTLLQPGDVIIDGGNTFYKDDIRRAAALKLRGIEYLDVGTSGGVWGLERGYCMMIGGESQTVERLDAIFVSLAPGAGEIAPTPGRQGRDARAEQGYVHAGPTGAGHFAKMIHNGIEYGLMQAYAEGFEILQRANSEALPSEQRYEFNLADLAEVWRRGSVISSWLLDLTASALAKDAGLNGFEGYVQDSGEGRWTVNAAIEEAVPAPVLSAALYARFRSRLDRSFADRLLSAMRSEFGGHQEPTKV
jgi:6-phosphogluconate dehydrogenase